MGSPAIYGYKAGTYVATAGVTTGEIRSSVIEPKKTNGWIYNFTARVGKAYSANPTAWLDMAIYNAAGPTSAMYPTTLVGEANTTVAVTGLMQNSSQGVDVSKAPAAPIKRFANTYYALALRSDLNHFNFGMNASGQRMAFRTHGGSFPASYAHTSNNPNGRIGMWADEIINTPPKTPSNVAPAESSSTTDVTPTLAADFRDDEETLPGFALGTADKVKKYQFKVMQGTTVIQDSTVLTADSTMRSNRRVTWTSPTLPAGTYTGWCQLYDEFEEKSLVKTWTFTVETSSLIPQLDPANVNQSSPLKTTSTTPGVRVTWDDDASTAMTFMTLVIREENTGLIARGPQLYPQALADLASVTKSGAALFAELAWPALATGQRYRWETRGYDGSSWSGYSVSEWFWVNAAPSVPTTFDPVNGKGVTSIPFLSAYFVDVDDESVDLDPQFYVRAEGDVTDGTLIPASPVWLGNGRWGIQPTSAQVTALGDWEWRARSVDPVGGVGTYSSWQSFTYTTPPDITFTNPAAPEDPVATTTPVLTWTVDRTQTSYRVRVYEESYIVWLLQQVLSGLLGIPFTAPAPMFYDSGYYHSSVGSHTIPTGKVLNNHEYVVVLDVRTSDGLEAQETTSFVVDYDERGKPTNFDVMLVQGPFESIPGHSSIVDVVWDPVPETTPAIFGLPLNDDLNGRTASAVVTATATVPSQQAPGSDGITGMYLDEATTNLIKDPLFVSSVGTFWDSWGSSGYTVDTDEAPPVGTNSARITAVGTGQGISPTTANAPAVSAATTYTLSGYMKGSGNVVLMGEVLNGSNAGIQYPGSSAIALTDQWERYSFTFTTPAGAAKFRPTFRGEDNGMTFWVAGAQLEAKAFATRVVAGSMGTGTAWTGPANNSSSTRVSSTLSIPGGPHISHIAGTMMFAMDLPADPDASANLNPVFVIGGGSNLMQFRRNGTNLWTFGGNDGAWKEINFSQSLSGVVVAEVEWSGSGSVARIRFDGGSWHTVPSAISWSAFSSSFATSSPNLLVRNFVTFNRVLTTEEAEEVRARVRDGTATREAALPYATDAEFGGYVVRRENLDTGEVERMERLPGRNLNGYTDREARSGFNYRWSVSYLYLYDDVEWVESVPGVEEFSLNLAALVLSDLQQDGLSVPIYWWDDRAITRYTATEVVATLGEKPITFQGVLNYRSLSLSFHTVDDPYGAYSAVEHFEAIEAFAAVARIGSDGKPIPRDICLRTPTRIIMYGSLVSPIVRNDDHDQGKISGTLTFVENATHLEEAS